LIEKMRHKKRHGVNLDGGFRTEDILVMEKFAPELAQAGVGSYICSERNRVRQQKLVPQRVITDSQHFCSLCLRKIQYS